MDGNGNVYSWGYNGDGQCDDGKHWTGRENSYTPTLIEKLLDIEVIKVKCGLHNFCSKSVDGRYWLWGDNGNKRCLRMSGLRHLESMGIDDEIMQN